MQIEIKSRFTGRVIFAIEAGSIRLAVEAAIEQGAYLKGAYLTGADLKGADLTGAYLKGADLTGADLTGAYLKGADLTGAYLKGADLTGADLTGAYLKGADLTGAINLQAAFGLKDEFLDGEPMKHASPEESVANLDKVREIVLDNAERLNMGVWHGANGWEERTCAEEAVCRTMHCLAGWLQVCSTDPKVRSLDPHLAGIVSAPVAAKMFFRNGDETLTWLKDRKYADEAKDYA